MIALAWQGVTSFSAAPLRVITSLGIAVSLISLALGFWALWVRLFSDDAVPGWASIVIPLFLISGVQLLSLGIIGEYLAKIFVETKHRPLYFIERFAPTNHTESRLPEQRLKTIDLVKPEDDNIKCDATHDGLQGSAHD